jgi:hypothetical protein
MVVIRLFNPRQKSLMHFQFPTALESSKTHIARFSCSSHLRNTCLKLLARHPIHNCAPGGYSHSVHTSRELALVNTPNMEEPIKVRTVGPAGVSGIPESAFLGRRIVRPARALSSLITRL